jgi:hypothetical protein
MAFEDYRNVPQTAPRADALEYDIGLRRHMVGVFNLMFLGLGLSAATAFFLVQTGMSALFFTAPGQMTPLGWVAVFAPLGLLLIASFAGQRLSAPALHGIYWSVAALQGVSVALLLQVYTAASAAQIFLITAIAFGALALYGYTTKRSLSGMGTFLIMGLIGVIIAFLVNLFLQSSLLHFVAASIGVLVFAGLTAYDTQRLKHEYFASAAGGDSAARVQVWGALSLYLNFINMFQLLLSLFGQRQE